MKLIMENWRQFINEKLLPYGDPLKRKTTKKRFEAALGRSVKNGEVIALDKRFHQVFKIAAQMKVWLAVDQYGRARMYDDMPEACKWARISCPTPEPKEEPKEEPQEEPEEEEKEEEPEEEEEEEEAEYQQITYRGKYGFETDPRTGRAIY